MSELTFAKRAIETFEICEKGPLKRFAKRCSSKISFAGFYILLCNFVRFLKTVFKDKKKCASSYFADSLQNVRICEKYENLQIVHKYVLLLLFASFQLTYLVQEICRSF